MSSRPWTSRVEADESGREEPPDRQRRNPVGQREGRFQEDPVEDPPLGDAHADDLAGLLDDLPHDRIVIPVAVFEQQRSRPEDARQKRENEGFPAETAARRRVRQGVVTGGRRIDRRQRRNRHSDYCLIRIPVEICTGRGPWAVESSTLRCR